jgi:hypothetical protein
MSAIFKAHIQENQIGGWCIKLTDEQSNEEIICANMEEFSQHLQHLSAPYGHDLKVQWSKADNLTPEHFYEVHQAIAKLNKELQSND